MDGHATNLEPFEAALDSLHEGVAAGHTATSSYVDSVWPVAGPGGGRAELIWPDYGGEQIKNIVTVRRVPRAWQDRARAVPAWLLLVRLQQTQADEDIFSKPLAQLRDPVEHRDLPISGQARLIELLQMLSFARGAALPRPRLMVVLTCWDELGLDGTPAEALAGHLPLLSAYCRTHWPDPAVLGLSALGKPLSPHRRDDDYVNLGPESFGYVILPDGSRSADLTLPVQLLLDGTAS